ncbi:hypothetical protein [Marinomonas primoryensis]|jgi:hypothetical protein|uniref:hypothetical protein n=1 Tax=Marinomonas primoryensis TaxID=178399 RepID=UPI00370450D5
MNDQSMKAFVTKADGKVIRVKLLDSSFKEELSNLGFSYDDELSEYFTQSDDNTIKAGIFEKLRDLDVSFSGGKEWCPAEVFEYLRETGLIAGQFKKVGWSGPGDYRLTVE